MSNLDSHQFSLSDSEHDDMFNFDDLMLEDFSHEDIDMYLDSFPTIQLSPSPPPSPDDVTEQVVKKKKRGRPRKNVPVNQVIDPMLPSSSSSKSDPNPPKRPRGRPPGTGKRQRLADLGEWMRNSAGLACALHVINVKPGEDVVSKIISYSQKRPKALSIISATGNVSSVTLNKPGSSVPHLYFQGNFEIKSLDGSYLVDEEGGPKSRIGGLSVFLAHPDGYMFGGGIATLIASTPVEVEMYSFLYGSAKAKALMQLKKSKEDKGNLETLTSETPSPVAEPAEAVVEVDQSLQDLPGWSDNLWGWQQIN